MANDRGYVITDENYQQQALIPVAITIQVAKAVFGPDWKRGALAHFGRLEVILDDVNQWERFGCPMWVMTIFERILKERQIEIEAALKCIPQRPLIGGVTV